MCDAPPCQTDQFDTDRRWYVVWFLVGLLLGICVIEFWPLPEGEVQLGHDIFAAEAQMMTISTCLMMFKVAQRDLPTSEEGLPALIDPPNRFKVRKRFIEKESILDPWGIPYGYARVEQKSIPGYDIWSAGPDKVHFTADDIIYRKR